MKISSLADGYKCFGATYDQHFQNKITQLSFIHLILQTREVDVIGITRGRAQNWWIFVLFCLSYNVDQNK